MCSLDIHLDKVFWTWGWNSWHKQWKINMRENLFYKLCSETSSVWDYNHLVFFPFGGSCLYILFYEIMIIVNNSILFCLTQSLAIGNTNKPMPISSFVFLLISLVCEIYKSGNNQLRPSIPACNLILWGKLG